MLVPPVDRRCALPNFCVVLLALFALVSPVQAQVILRGQRIQIIQGGQVPIGFLQPQRQKIQLTAPHVDEISGNTASRLEQMRALVADKNWDEAGDILRELSADTSDRVVALDADRYVSLPIYCQWELAHLPADVAAAYRRRVDPLAEQRYREGMTNRNEAQLGRVVDELFCSSWGDDALLALGELALERGDYTAARRYWEQISPLTRDPNGKPLWLSLRGVDLDKHWPEIERRWPLRPQPPTWLAYPDTDIDLADVRARLTLVSIRAGELDRAALELETFRRWHPNAAGRFGGQEGPYTAALEKLLASAKEWPAPPPDRNWPTFAGTQSRSPAAAPVGQFAKASWATTIALSESDSPRHRAIRTSNNQPPDAQVRESERALSYFPVVVDGLLLYADATTVSAVNLATGKPTITPDGKLFHVEATAGDANAAMLRSQFVAAGVPRFSLTVIDGIVYARVGQVTTARLQPGAPSPVGERLVGIDLKRDGLLAFQAKPDDEGWSFDGTPVGDGRRVYVAMRHGDVTPHAYVACFDVATGHRLWRASIGSADTSAGGAGDEITHNLLSLVGDRIYFNTNLGLVAALDTEEGRIQWICRYERRADMSTATSGNAPLHFDRDPSPCLIHDGLVIVAPSDTPLVFALDADTGRPIWWNDKLADALHLLGVVDESLIVTGNRFCSLDVRTGRTRFAWPESEHAGIRGMGHGALAGSEVFWPTRKEIYFFDAHTGARTRPPVDLSSVSEGGANLIAANGYLVVAGREALTAAGPAPAQPLEKSKQPPKVAAAN